MTINEVIERVDTQKPNVVPEEVKASWLIALDGILYLELLQGRPAPAPIGGQAQERLPPVRWPEEGDVALLVSAPYDKIYELYLEAMIDFYHREPMLYQNSRAMFNSAMGDFRKHYHRTHEPVGVRHFSLP